MFKLCKLIDNKCKLLLFMLNLFRNKEPKGSLFCSFFSCYDYFYCLWHYRLLNSRILYVLIFCTHLIINRSVCRIWQSAASYEWAEEMQSSSWLGIGYHMSCTSYCCKGQHISVFSCPTSDLYHNENGKLLTYIVVQLQRLVLSMSDSWKLIPHDKGSYTIDLKLFLNEAYLTEG